MMTISRYDGRMAGRLGLVVAALVLAVWPLTGARADGNGEGRAVEALQLQVATLEQLLRGLEVRSEELEAALARSEALRHEEGLIRDGLAMREQLPAPESPALAWSLNDAGLLMAAEGRLSEAQLLFERALAVLDAHVEPMHPARGTLLQNLGETLWRRNDPDAVERFRDAAIVFGTTAGPSHPRMAALLNAWAAALAGQGRADEAETLYQRAIRIYEDQRERHPLDLVAPLYNLALLKLERQEIDEAGALLDRAYTVLRRNRETESARMLLVLRALARQRRLAGELDRAARFDEQAAELAVKHAGLPTGSGRSHRSR